MWGSLDSSYALRRIITGDLGGGPVNWLAVLNLLFRLFQAHIMMGWLFILLIGSKLQPLLDPSSIIRRAPSALSGDLGSWNGAWVSFCIRTVSVLRGCSVVSIIATMLLYDLYHHAGAVKRWNKPQAGMRSQSVSLRRFPWSLFDLCAIVGGILFGIVPLFHAQFMHLFTSTLTYTVSLKATKLGRGGVNVTLGKLHKHRRKDSSLPV